MYRTRKRPVHIAKGLICIPVLWFKDTAQWFYIHYNQSLMKLSFKLIMIIVCNFERRDNSIWRPIPMLHHLYYRQQKFPPLPLVALPDVCWGWDMDLAWRQSSTRFFIVICLINDSVYRLPERVEIHEKRWIVQCVWNEWPIRKHLVCIGSVQVYVPYLFISY